MILGLETATSVLGVALVSEGSVRASITIARKHVHDDFLVPLCGEIIRYAEASMSDIRAVAVSAGPGSYTGLRIGMAAAKGLCLALEIPLISVPTLDAAANAFATSAAHDNTSLALCLDAKNNEVYFASYIIRRGSAINSNPTTILSTSQAAVLIDDDAVLAGDGALSVVAYRNTRHNVLTDPTQLFRGDMIALLGEQFAKQQKFSDITTCEPLYLRGFTVKPPRNIFAP